jgi:hypothetical protein
MVFPRSATDITNEVDVNTRSGETNFWRLHIVIVNCEVAFYYRFPFRWEVFGDIPIPLQTVLGWREFVQLPSNVAPQTSNVLDD